MYMTLYMYMYMCMHMYEERGGGRERESRHLRFNKKMKQRITIRQNKLRRHIETHLIPRFGRKS